ncbi:MAG: 50S ribosomal protein L23 [Peptococcaceae bacterium]|nr:50S ribosomal protein L23 [Peptococcaceae bacterium]MBT9135107.1 50S ribosomal protein L23 [Bacillota bacterium]MBT9151964.1 50S ribosomal protein L23 [Bacillota bacterium]MBT9157477.1 50S ribosomal protein L23 [Bacillota bacterium]
MRDARDIIKKPIISERTTALQTERKYVFSVDPKANKTEIRQAVELLFKVEVEAVNTMHVTGKFKRHGVHSGYRSDWKKAIVKLTPKSKTIPIFDSI